MLKQRSNPSTEGEVCDTTYPHIQCYVFIPWPHVILNAPKTVVYIWTQVTPVILMTDVTTAINTNEPSDVNGFDNDPTQVKYLGLPTSQSELKKPLMGGETQELTTKSGYP